MWMKSSSCETEKKDGELNKMLESVIEDRKKGP